MESGYLSSGKLSLQKPAIDYATAGTSEGENNQLTILAL